MDERLSALGLANPVADPTAVRTRADRVPTLSGTVVGLLDNHKDNADILLTRIGEILKAEYGVKDTIMRQKFLPSMVAEPRVLDEFAQTCDVVVASIADCGSCTSCLVHDGLELEDRGIATAALCTPVFLNSFELHAKYEGREDYEPVMVDTISTKSSEEIADLAAAIVPSIVAVLTKADG